LNPGRLGYVAAGSQIISSPSFCPQRARPLGARLLAGIV
jgi:hypothetical protein